MILIGSMGAALRTWQLNATQRIEEPAVRQGSSAGIGGLMGS